MSELLREWLRESASIDVDISFEDAFCDGTLMARLLYNLGLFNAIEKIHKTSSRSNFALLRPCLRKLGVAYPPNLVQRILDRQSGAALTLLHAIKMEHDSSLVPKTLQPIHHGHIVSGAVPTHERGLKNFDKLEQAYLENVLRLNLRPLPLKCERGLQQRFAQELESNVPLTQQEDEDNRALFRLIRVAEMDEGIRTKDYEEAFGRRKWQKFKESLEKLRVGEQELKARLNARMDLKRKKKLEAERAAVQNELKAFDEHLEFIRSQEEVFYSTEELKARTERSDASAAGADEGVELSERLPDRFTQTQTAWDTIAAINANAAIQNRESKRRRQRVEKLLADQCQSSLLEQDQQRQLAYRDMICRRSVHEKNVDNRSWRVGQFYELVQKNRQLRDSRISELVADDNELALARDAQHFAIEEALYEQRLELESKRRVENRTRRLNEDAAKTYELCARHVDDIVHLSVRSAMYQSLLQCQSVPSDVFSEWKICPRQRFPPLPADDAAHELHAPDDDVADLAVLVLTDATPEHSELIDRDLFTRYLKAQEPFDSVDELRERFDGSDNDVAVSAAIESEEGSEELGRCVHFVVQRALPAPDTPTGSIGEWKYVYCIIGKRFSGKSSLAHALETALGIAVVNVDQLLENALEAEVDPLGERARRILRQGDAVGDCIYLELLQRHLVGRKQDNPGLKGFVLDGFPETRHQAEALEKLLSGFELKQRPDEHGRASLDRMSQLVPYPDGLLELPQPPFASAITDVLWLDLDDASATRRSVGRRIDHLSQRSFHIESAKPSFDEIVKETLEPVDPDYKLQDQLDTFEANATRLLEWFGLFNGVVRLDATQSTVELAQLIVDRLPKDSTMTNSSSDELNVAVDDESKTAAEVSEQEKVDVPAAAAASIETSLENENMTEPEEEPQPSNVDEAPAESSASELDERLEQDVSACIHEMPARMEARCVSDSFIDKEVADICLQRWWCLEELYATTFKKVMRMLRSCRVDAARFQAVSRERFRRFVCRQDARQSELDAFIERFNAFERSLRSDPNVKAELHLRKLELYERLRSLQSTKQKQEQDSLTSLFKDSWLSDQKSRELALFIGLIQSEMKRHHDAAKFFSDVAATRGGGTPQAIDAVAEVDLSEELAALQPAEEQDETDGAQHASKGKDAKKTSKEVKKDGKKDVKQGLKKTAEMDSSEEDTEAPESNFAVGTYASDSVEAMLQTVVVKVLTLLQEEASTLQDAACYRPNKAEIALTANRVRRLASRALSRLKELRTLANEFLLSLLEISRSRHLTEINSIETLKSHIEDRIESDLPIVDSLIFEGDTIVQDVDMKIYDEVKDAREKWFEETTPDNGESVALSLICDRLLHSAPSGRIHLDQMKDALSRIQITSSTYSAEISNFVREEASRFLQIVSEEESSAPNSNGTFRLDWSKLVFRRAVELAGGAPSHQQLVEAVKNLSSADSDQDGAVTIDEFRSTRLWTNDELVKSVMFDSIASDGSLDIMFFIGSLCTNSDDGSWIEHAIATVAPNGLVTAESLANILSEQIQLDFSKVHEEFLNPSDKEYIDEGENVLKSSDKDSSELKTDTIKHTASTGLDSVLRKAFQEAGVGFDSKIPVSDFLKTSVGVQALEAKRWFE